MIYFITSISALYAIEMTSFGGGLLVVTEDSVKTASWSPIPETRLQLYYNYVGHNYNTG